jgi:cellobiose phosphorylase
MGDMKRTTKSFKTKYGFFSEDGREYRITAANTPRPWTNVVSNGEYGFVISQTGGGYSWRTHAQLNRITRWEQDLIRDDWGKFLYLRDEKKNVWSAAWKPVCARPDRYQCRHGLGYSVIESRNRGIESELLAFVPNDEPLEIWRLTLRNLTRRRRRISIYSFFEWALGASPDWHREFHRTFIETSFDSRARGIFATKRFWEVPGPHGHWNTDWPYTAFHGSSFPPSSFDTDKETFLGRYGSLRMPEGIARGKLACRTGKWLDPIGSLHVTLSLDPGEVETVVFTLGAAFSRAEAAALMKKYRSSGAVDKALQAVRQRWEAMLGTLKVSTPDDAINLMTNTWLKYQAISGRLWGRTAYYQTGGAYGFRDQLQDSQVFLPIDPSRTKEQIELHTRHQFKDGTVYHWWHPISELGLRNQVSDNLLWLPFVLMNYLRETADFSFLDRCLPFVDDDAGASLYEHCTRALDRSLQQFSKRGLPLIGGGDWNDGLSAVGLEMRGESIWLGHFLHYLLLEFADLAGRHNDRARALGYRARADRLKRALNELGWDGEWYFRATKDSGEKIGSRENREGKIFLNAQTWAVIGGVAEGERAEQVMDAVEQKLEFKAGPLLLHPAYTRPDMEIGYLSRYAPGVRENGGVYTHAATWAVLAETILGRGASAYRMASKLNPITRGMKPEEYYAEPYVTPGNIDGPDSPNYGRGGWTWYTGSAAWLFRVMTEHLLGVRPLFEGLLVDPCIPPGWKGFSMTRQFRGAVYKISVRNPHRVESGVIGATIDGLEFEVTPKSRGVLLPLFAAGTEHEIVVTLGEKPRTQT